MWRSFLFLHLSRAPFTFFSLKKLNRCTLYSVDSRSLRVCVGTRKISMILKYTGIQGPGGERYMYRTQLRCYAT
jgi:hypothetical protein